MNITNKYPGDKYLHELRDGRAMRPYSYSIMEEQTGCNRERLISRINAGLLIAAALPAAVWLTADELTKLRGETSYGHFEPPIQTNVSGEVSLTFAELRARGISRKTVQRLANVGSITTAKFTREGLTISAADLESVESCNQSEDATDVDETMVAST